ncbi:MAG TPA: STAS domain-containing protein [Solirubrobacteraceae bacterium]|nr:STAS domain-containing protein [Solirubrobacteraceae bacterium]
MHAESDLASRSRTADGAAASGGPAQRPATPGELRVTERDRDGVRVVEAAGELDLSTAPSLCLRLESARGRRDLRVLLDLGSLEFCDSTGLRAVILAGQEITASAGTFCVVVPPGTGAVARLFELSGVAEFVPVFATVEEGLAFLRSRGGAGTA